MSWLTLTPTALFRRHREPVFLPPRVWPKKVWKDCACTKRFCYWPNCDGGHATGYCHAARCAPEAEEKLKIEQ